MLHDGRVEQQGDAVGIGPEPSSGHGELLRAAAVIGETFDLDLLAAVVGRPVLECLDALSAPVGHKVVEPLDGPERYRFVDAATHRQVLDGIPGSDRVRLHARIAEELGSRYGDQLDAHLFELAAHWSAAAVGDHRAPAAGWISRAASVAAGDGSHEHAARLYRRAIDIGTGALGADVLADLRLGLARAAYRCGDVSSAISAAADAANDAAQAGRPDLVAAAALVVEPSVVPGINDKVRRACVTALAALGEDPSTDRDEVRASRVRVLARLADVCHYLSDDAAADRASRALDELLAGCRDESAVATALHAQQLAASGADGVARRDELTDRLAELAQALDDPVERTWSHLWRIDVALQRGEISRATHEIKLALGVTTRTDDIVIRWELLRAQAAVAQAQARFGDAITIAGEAEQVMTAVGNPVGRFIWTGQVHNVCHHTGMSDEYAAAMRTAASAGTAAETPLIVALTLADLLRTTGDRDAAWTVYRSLGPAEHWRPAAHSDLFAWAYGVKVATSLGETQDVESLRERLGARRGLHVASGAGAIGYLGPVELWLGVAAAHLGAYEAAVPDLEHALVACGANGAAGFQAEVQLQLARALLGRGAPGDALRARHLAASAAERAELLGMRPVAAAARETVERTLPARIGVLTRREREVAVLVADGLSNRAIARRLHLSERTAANHVQHILDKLALDNRTQVGAWLSTERMSTTE